MNTPSLNYMLLALVSGGIALLTTNAASNRATEKRQAHREGTENLPVNTPPPAAPVRPDGSGR